tara:strand:- start:229 stop:807 length:579 start_codon:yes stop_codon:yes gene_type:complete
MPIHIITIHGLGGSPYPHYPLIEELKRERYNSDTFEYNSMSLSLNEASNLLIDFIEKKVSDDKIILVGHSAGGRIALLTNHVKIVGVITVSSPIQGSYFAARFRFASIYFGPMLLELCEKHSEDITVPIATITTSYFNNFDGRVWKEEMIHKNSCFERHIDNSFHSGNQMKDLRMIIAIKEAISYLLQTVIK